MKGGLVMVFTWFAQAALAALVAHKYDTNTKEYCKYDTVQKGIAQSNTKHIEWLIIRETWWLALATVVKHCDELLWLTPTSIPPSQCRTTFNKVITSLSQRCYALYVWIHEYGWTLYSIDLVHYTYTYKSRIVAVVVVLHRYALRKKLRDYLGIFPI